MSGTKTRFFRSKTDSLLSSAKVALRCLQMRLQVVRAGRTGHGHSRVLSHPNPASATAARGAFRAMSASTGFCELSGETGSKDTAASTPQGRGQREKRDSISCRIIPPESEPSRTQYLDGSAPRR